VLLLSTLEHVNLPQIYDAFTDSEHWYLVMDFIGGETLEQYLRNTTHGSSPATTRSLPLDEVFSIALQLCHVLHYLHMRQPPIIFRDLKPANVMRAPEGNLYLIDFGIARHFKPGQAKDTMPFGSPGYAAPEQYGKAQTTPQSDLYSLGALLHQLLSGEDPAETPFRFAPLRLYGTAGLAELEALIMRMVDMDPGKRPASAAEVKEELRRIVMVRMLRTHEEPRLWRPGQPHHGRRFLRGQVNNSSRCRLHGQVPPGARSSLAAFWRARLSWPVQRVSYGSCRVPVLSPGFRSSIAGMPELCGPLPGRPMVSL
jgi:serine/threonine protein kinase